MAELPLWVFGYGSLMWHPGFEHSETAIARLPGFQRSFCMRSIHHRGTVDEPGLVLALDKNPDANCEGLAFRVSTGFEESTIAYLRERELISSAYLEAYLPVELRDGRQVQVLTFVVDSDHVQYCHGIPLLEQAEIITAAHGGRGPNSEYLFSTMEHLRLLELVDQDLEWLDGKVRELL